MSIIKQISVYNGSSWEINDIGANAGNIDLIAPDSSTATNLAGSSNLFTALNNILPTNQLTASRALVTNSSKKLAASATTATQLSYVHGVTSNIQTQLDTLNTNLTLTESACAQIANGTVDYNLVQKIGNLVIFTYQVTGASIAGINGTICRLPDNCRPSSQRHITARVNYAGTLNSYHLKINTDGNVTTQIGNNTVTEVYIFSVAFIM